MTGECLKLTQLWTLIYKKLPTLRAHKTLVNLWQISVLMHRFSPKQRFLWKKTRNKKTLPVLFPLPWLHIFCSSPARSVKQRSWLETWLPKWLIFGIIGGAKKMWCSFYGFSGRKLGWFHQIGGYKTWGVKRMGGGGLSYKWNRTWNDRSYAASCNGGMSGLVYEEGVMMMSWNHELTICTYVL